MTAVGAPLYLRSPVLYTHRRAKYSAENTWSRSKGTPVAMDKETVKHVATLSRLAMSDAELDRFAEQVSAILDYIDKLASVPMSPARPFLRRRPWRMPRRGRSASSVCPASSSKRP